MIQPIKLIEIDKSVATLILDTTLSSNLARLYDFSHTQKYQIEGYAIVNHSFTRGQMCMS